MRKHITGLIVFILILKVSAVADMVPGFEISGTDRHGDNRIRFADSIGSTRFFIQTDTDAYFSKDLLEFRSRRVDNQFVLKGNGYIGMGTANPEGVLHLYRSGENNMYLESTDSHARLEIRGDKNHWSMLRLASPEGNQWSIRYRSNHMNGALQFAPYGGDAAMLVTQTGRVGVGVDSPESTMHIDGTLRLESHFISDVSGSDATRMKFLSNDGSERFLVKTTLHPSESNDELTFRSEFVDNILSLKGDGDVGIGTQNPEGAFHLYRSDENNMYIESMDSHARLEIRGDKNHWSMLRLASPEGNQWSIRYRSNHMNGALQFAPYGGDAAMLVTQAGSVGIGAEPPLSSASSLLHVEGGLSLGGNYAATKTHMHILAQDDSSRFRMQSQMNANTAKDVLKFRSMPTDDILALRGNGFVGIGTDDPQNWLHIYTREHTASFHLETENKEKNAAIYISRDEDASSVGYAASSSLLRINNSDSIEDNHLTIDKEGHVGIGTDTPEHALHIKGSVYAQEFVSAWNQWADKVFEPSYDLRTLSDLRQFIQENKHLPELPSEKEVLTNGIGLNELQVKLLTKIEENVLYILQLEQQNKDLGQENRGLEAQLATLEARVSALEN